MTIINTDEYIPTDANGIKGFNAVAKKATEVVLEVIAVDLAALLNAYANLLVLSFLISMMLLV